MLKAYNFRQYDPNEVHFVEKDGADLTACGVSPTDDPSRPRKTTTDKVAVTCVLCKMDLRGEDSGD